MSGSILRTAARRVAAAVPATPVMRAPVRHMSHHHAPSFNPSAYTMTAPTAVLGVVVGVPTVVCLILWNIQMGRFQG